ncbi:MAG: hypothetical protein WC650_00210 [Candidatus Doudnabacteria bacterium]
MLRIPAIIFLLIIIIALGAYAAWQGPRGEITSWEAVAAPEKYEGREIKAGYNRIIGGGGSYWTVGPFGHYVVLKIDPRLSLEPGNFISYQGQVRKDGYIETNEIYIHKERGFKYLVSLIPLFVILFWFGREYRFNQRKFYFEEK